MRSECCKPTGHRRVLRSVFKVSDVYFCFFTVICKQFLQALRLEHPDRLQTSYLMFFTVLVTEVRITFPKMWVFISTTPHFFFKVQVFEYSVQTFKCVFPVSCRNALTSLNILPFTNSLVCRTNFMCISAALYDSMHFCNEDAHRGRENVS